MENTMTKPVVMALTKAEMQQKLDTLYNELLGVFYELDLPLEPILSVTINGRLTRTFGLARTRIDAYNPENKIHWIEISPLNFVEGKPEILRDTLAHEMCHCCTGSVKHGETFMRYAKRLNAAIGSKIGQYFNPRSYGLTEAPRKRKKEQPKYTVYCKKCGRYHTFYRKTEAIKNIENYRCARCKGELAVTTCENF